MRAVRTGAAIGLAAQLLLLAVLAGSVGLSPSGWLAGLACCLVTDALLIRALARSGADGLGAANAVTLARATLVGGVVALVTDSFTRPTPLGALVSLTVAALVLDAVDGQVARRTDTVSKVGARFDMEVDAFLILVLSVYVAGTIGPWVLAIGAARYLYVAASGPLCWLRDPPPPRSWRKWVAAIQGIVLAAAVADVLPVRLMEVTLVAAFALLAESFGRDVVWLWRYRRVPARSRVDSREPLGVSLPLADR